jgi:hypothetical protein
MDALVFDACLNETPTYDADVTHFPVEEGSAVTDNVRPLPTTLKLEVTVTDYPLSGAGRGINGASSDVNPTLSSSPFTGRAEQILQTLIALRDGGIRCTVESGVRVYSNMVMEGVTPPRDKARFGALRISIKMREVRTVSSEIVAVAKISEPKAMKKKDAAGHEAKAAEEPVPKSWTASGIDWIRGK